MVSGIEEMNKEWWFILFCVTKIRGHQVMFRAQG